MEHKNVPEHVAFIMDGNRRWAKARGIETIYGHRHGYDKLKEVGDWCLARDIKHLTVFAFSTENWNRSKEEVEYLMDLLYGAMTHELDEFKSRGLKLKIIGRKEGLPDNVRQAVQEAEEATSTNGKATLYLAINYGGRAEIVDAAKNLLLSKVDPESLTEQSFREHLYGAAVPDPDLIIRTSGEQRLSGFLTWQSAYSELYFTDVLWPDFSEHDFDEALAWYKNNERRFGK